MEEIKVRWKKAALENCPGIPCTVTPPPPPPPPFACGTSTVTDIDNNVYTTVLIGTQCWTGINLRVTKYSDGTPIPLDATGSTVGTSTTWNNLTIGSYTIYANGASSGTHATDYGFLYNWNAAKGITTAGSTTYKNICPTGWHVPTDAERTTLTTHLGGVSVAGGKMKKNDSKWTTNTGTNSSGFSGLPGGSRQNSGLFSSVNDYATFWTTTEHSNTTDAFVFELSHSNPTVDAYRVEKEYGQSVRCLKD